MPHAVSPRILFIDAYDSFSNNIISLIQSTLNVDVTVIRIDEEIDDFSSFLRPFSAVIAGPGPGHPKNDTDVGLFNDLWTLEEESLLPVLGICLGFQSLILAFGGKVEALPQPRHGIPRNIRSNKLSIFKDLSNIISVQYHSLYATLDDFSVNDIVQQSELVHLQNENTKFSPLFPLAWDFEGDNQPLGFSGTQNTNPTAILMAVGHNTKPFFGIQFHPESICSNENARKVLLNWWVKVQEWNRMYRVWTSPKSEAILSQQLNFASQFPLKHKVSHDSCNLNKINVTNRRRTSTTACPEKKSETQASVIEVKEIQPTSDQLNSSPQDTSKIITHKILSQSFSLRNITVPSVCETLKLQNVELILLESELHQRSEIGTHSIIGLITPTTLKLEYNVSASLVHHIQGGVSTVVGLRAFDNNIFSYLKHFMKHHTAEDGNSSLPFWGGLMGYITYEACLETIGIRPEVNRSSRRPNSRQNPDLSFVFVERSIVFDHQQQRLHIQSIRPHDHEWVSMIASHLRERNAFIEVDFNQPGPFSAKIFPPDEYVYKSNIRDCQESISKGNAYELCLTTQSKITTASPILAWPLYLRLRNHNPAPFSAYVRLSRLTLLSSSPERFLCWSRPAVEAESATDGITNPYSAAMTVTCQFRPIKGTVNRTPKDPNASPVTFAEATAILSTVKEKAENLMIVDLIRHDLHGVVGPSNVLVPKLMVVEEYATLYQLVTVIEGTLHVRDQEYEGITHDVGEVRECPNIASDVSASMVHACHYDGAQKSGIDILAASLPPGSMTGAPKRRACQLLHALENRPRGVYSGVLGYLDVGGGGDFSVVIRSAFRWDSATSHPDYGDDLKLSEEAPPCPGEDDEKVGNDQECENKIDIQPKSNSNAPCEDIWRVGAGGAVTSLSTEDGEWEEMKAKLYSTMGIFDSREDSSL